MSNFLAVATVTASLRKLLLETVPADVGGANVSTVRPDERGKNGIPEIGINIFLYEIRSNPTWRNADLPSRSGNGQATQRPRVALELHYLLSFYGLEQNYEPDRLLASTMSVLHARSILTRSLIQQTIAENLVLAGSNLDTQEELVRLSHLPMSTEELSRIWSILLQTRYVLSVAYQASPVLVERDETIAPTLPVRAASVHALPLPQPHVEKVVPQDDPDLPVFAGDRIAVLGRRLAGPITRVQIGQSEVPPERVAETRIELTLPPGLRAGVLGVQVRHDVALGTPAIAHRAFGSNMAAFVLHPTITKTGGAYDISVTDVQGAGAAPRSAKVTVKVTPAVGMDQQVTLELLSSATVVQTVRATAPSTETNMIVFAVREIPAGQYLVRVRIDGAESPLELDTDPASGTFNQPLAPRITIP